jgi:hypothetical protein
MTKKKTAVLIHGHFLTPDVWPRVMWGDPRNGKFGVLPKGMKLAQELVADVVYIGNGVPNVGGREFNPDMAEYLERRKLEIGLGDYSPEIHFDGSVQTTADEIANAAVVFRSHKIQEIYLVTAPKHAFRAHQLALVAKDKGSFPGMSIFATASDIDFPGTSAGTVAIIEAAHRHDIAKWNLWKYAAALLGVLKLPETETFAFLGDLDRLLDGQGIKVTWKKRED